MKRMVPIAGLAALAVLGAGCTNDYGYDRPYYGYSQAMPHRATRLLRAGALSRLWLRLPALRLCQSLLQPLQQRTGDHVLGELPARRLDGRLDASTDGPVRQRQGRRPRRRTPRFAELDTVGQPDGQPGVGHFGVAKDLQRPVRIDDALELPDLVVEFVRTGDDGDAAHRPPALRARGCARRWPTCRRRSRPGGCRPCPGPCGTTGWPPPRARRDSPRCPSCRARPWPWPKRAARRDSRPIRSASAPPRPEPEPLSETAARFRGIRVTLEPALRAQG